MHANKYNVTATEKSIVVRAQDVN